MNMIERVARAIQDKLPGWLAEDGTVDDVDLARAAIQAMREPTDAMMYAGNSSRVASKQIGHNTAATWEAMIDAALQECD